MADRALLHKDKLEDFKSWLDYKGLEHRPGRGDWQELQVRTGKTWHVIYSRAHMPEHLTVPEPIIPLVANFVREGREAAIQGTARAVELLRGSVDEVPDDDRPW